MTWGLLLAFACSIGLGAVLWFAIAGIPRRRCDQLAAGGYTFLLGLSANGLLVGLRPEVPGVALFAAMLPLLAAVFALLLVAGWWRLRHAVPARSEPVDPDRLPYWAWLLLAAITLRFAFVLDEALLRPVFAWDAWNAWSLKAKTWFSLGQVPYVEPRVWWQSTDPDAHTALAWRYPGLLSRIELWLAAGAGAWNEGAIASAWPLLWLALIVGCAGQWRALGASRRGCVVFAYLLASLPLLSVHAGLAGYADLWVAAALAFAVLSGLRWLQDGDRSQLALALACTAILPLLKFEGAIWALLVVGVAVLVQVPPRWRGIGLAIAVLLALVTVGLSWTLQLPWLALVREMLSGAAVGDLDFSSSVAATQLFKGLFTQNNWHLLWPLLVTCLIWRRDQLQRREVMLLALVLASGLSALFALFVFTPAARWAATETATNRLVLHWVPLALSLVVLLLRDAKVLVHRPDVSPR
ncbi:MAG: hypothetical protein JNN30_12180 [Rhodanobacteraceae bacterium]|nr:hypothetical protein [Rhodanobacteraceae bacterium]